MAEDVLISVQNVSKKFCKSLKRSLWYGLGDMAAETIGGSRSHDRLRTNEFWALREISFELRRGECLGLIGHNGAGKTTLLRMLNGLIKPDHGRIEMRGRIGALIALGTGFNPVLTGRQNIYVNGSVLGLTRREIDAKIDEIIEFADIGEFVDSPVQSYSSGMQVRLGFAVATALQPDILLLDEVLAVGDAAFRAKCFNRIYEVLETAAVIFVSHNMAQVTRICNRIMLLREGRDLQNSTHLGNVISKYHEEQHASLKPTMHGSGKGTIHDVHIEAIGRVPTAKILHGEPFDLVISFSVLRPFVIRDLTILVTVSDQEESNVAQIMDRLDKPGTLNTNTRIEFRMAIKHAPFGAGRYFVTANLLLGERGELLCVVRNATSFVVQHDISGYAPILLKPSHSEFLIR